MFADVADKPGGAGGPAGTAQACGRYRGSRLRRASPGTRKRGLRLNMANNPKKVKDPTEVALSAIQEALNISDVPVDTTRSAVRSDAPPAEQPATPPYDDGSFDFRPTTDRPAFEAVEEQRAPRRAANDDRETIGQLLQALQKGRPARNVDTLATLFAGVWLLGAGLLTVNFLPSLQASIGQGSGQLVLAGPRAG